MKCVAKKKKRYQTLKMANDYISVYNRNPLLKEKDLLSTYHCKLHDGWHVCHVENTNDLPPVTRIHRLLDSLQEGK